MKCWMFVPISICLVCCGGDWEEIGITDYYLDNQSSYELTAEFFVNGYSDTEPQKVSVAQSTKDVIFQDWHFGFNPIPESTFKSFQILAMPPGSSNLVVVYTQDPILDSLWSGGRTDAEDYGMSEYTLSIVESDLNPQDTCTDVKSNLNLS